MHPEKIKFSKTTLDSLPKPEKGIFYFDTEVAGLAIRVLPSGSKTYYLYKRLKGKDYRIRIGSVQDLTVTKARELATHYKENILSDKKVHSGVIDNKSITLLEMYSFFLNEKRKYLSPNTVKEYQKLWNEYCQKLAKRPSNEISTVDLKNLHYHLTVENGTPYAANRTIMLLKAVYNLCIREGIFNQLNPCLAVKLNPEQPRIRALSEEELKKFLSVVKNYHDIKARSAILIMLYTGVRKSNVLSMRWEDIDLNKNVWVIPKTKTSRNEPIALVPQVVEVLKEMQHISTNRYVFSSYSKTGHLTHIEGNWKVILQKTGLKNLRLHDLRHTLATRLIANGVPVFAVKKILTHKSIQSTQVYVNLGVEDIRKDLIKTIDKFIGKE